MDYDEILDQLLDFLKMNPAVRSGAATLTDSKTTGTVGK